MYSSIYSKRANVENSSQNGRSKSKTSQSDQISINGLEVNVRPVLDYEAKLLGGKLTVKKIINERTFFAFHDEFMEDFILKCLPSDENIKRWIDLPPHTNIATAFDQISHEGRQFSLAESTNAGNMYQYIDSLGLNLAINVPQSYIEMIYDCIIQLAMGMEFAHNNGLVHGQFDLSNVMITKDSENLMYKISDFRPVSSLNMPLTSEGTMWPFARNKKKISEAEKLELLMLKDIYALGICILEMMIGRISSSKFSISLDSLPLTWAEFPESTPLIQVLVECINIDSITQRKGKLQTIKKLLIKEYKKFFQRSFYKMELPVVGNRADVYNKKAIMALSRGEDDLAMQFWEEAWNMKDQHFDTQLNYLTYKWRIGQMSDDEMIAEMSKEIFSIKDIGQGLKAIIQIAIGDKQEGLDTLKSMLTAYKDENEVDQNHLKNLKVQRFMAQIKEIFKTVQSEKTLFPQNLKVKSEHKEKIEYINVNVNSRYLCSTSKDAVNIWSLNPQVQKLITIPFDQDQTSQGQFSAKGGFATRILATVDSECKICVIYKGQNFTFQTYTLDPVKKIFNLRDTIDLVKELQRANLLESKFDEFDLISEIKLINDGKILRVIQLRKKQPYLIDINLFDCTPEMRKIDKYEDKSIFKYGLTYVQHHESLSKFINFQLSRGNLLTFPEKEFQILVVLSREDKTNKNFLVYEIFTERFSRKIRKVERPLRAGQDESDAFDVDIDGRTLIYVSGDELVFQSLRVPESIQKYIKPRYNQAQHKENPAKIAAQRQTFKEKIIKNMRAYSQLMPDQLNQRENCLLLMHKKMESGFQNKRLIFYNEEFLELHKMLIKYPMPNCPIVGVESIKKIGIFDELKFTNDLHRIRFISISSELLNNYMIIAVDGTVYKYDISTKEMLFSFKTQAFKGMRLYDEDSYLLAADTQQLKLWEFIHEKDDAPEMVSVLQVPLKVEQAFVNYAGDDFYQIITCKELFEVYHDKLDKVFDGSIPSDEQIKTVEFNRTGTCFFIGSNKGRVYKFTIRLQKQEGNPFQLEDEGNVDILYSVNGVKEYDTLIGYVNGKGLRGIWFDKNKQEKFTFEQEIDGDVCQVKASQNAQFVFAGVPSTSSFCVLKFDQETLILSLLKRIQIDFQTFEMDDYCTQIIFMNQRCRQLEFYAVKWEFDMSKINMNEYERLDDKIFEDDEQRYNQQLKTNNKGLTNDLAADTAGGRRKKGGEAAGISSDGAMNSTRPKTACCSIF